MAEDSRKLFVAGLPDSVSEDVLRQLFEATGGNVVEVSLPKDRATGRPRGFGFVTLATVEEAVSARESLDGSFQGGKSISVRPFQAEPPKRDGIVGVRGPGMGMGMGMGAGAGPGSVGGGMGSMGGPGLAAAPDRTLYVGNLPYDATQEEVEGLITATGAGPVVRTHLPMDPEGRKRGFGFVTMSSAETAKAAIDGLRGADIRGRRLVVNLAHPKGERPAGERSFGPPGAGGGGFEPRPPGGGGGPERSFAPAPAAPPPGRKFEDKRRRGGFDGEGPAAPGAAAGAGKRSNNRNNNWERGGRGDWEDE
jgi:nucleolin